MARKTEQEQIRGHVTTFVEGWKRRKAGTLTEKQKIGFALAAVWLENKDDSVIFLDHDNEEYRKTRDAYRANLALLAFDG